MVVLGNLDVAGCGVVAGGDYLGDPVEMDGVLFDDQAAAAVAGYAGDKWAGRAASGED